MLNNMKLFCCKTMMDEIEAVKPRELEADYIEYALHDTPDKLRATLQEKIDRETEAHTIAFAYGLCSRGLDGLIAGSKTLVIPMVHDCISLLLGSRESYNREFKMSPGTYYLSKGWIDQKADPYKEYLEYVEKYGEKNARMISQEMYKNYKRLAFIDTNLENLEAYEDYARQVAAFLGVQFVQIKGQGSYFSRLVSGEWDEGFLVVPPGSSSDFNELIGSGTGTD